MTDRDLYLSWVNDFLTVVCFAEYYGLSVSEAVNLIDRERLDTFECGRDKPNTEQSNEQVRSLQ